MKIAVSIPNAVFSAAERKAQQKGVSRSRLYTEALELLLSSDHQEELTSELNRLFADDDRSDAAFALEASRRLLMREQW